MKINGKEYEDTHRITTNLFLEKCRVSHIACSLLIQYVMNPELRAEIDSTIKSVKPVEMADVLLAFRLSQFWEMELSQWLEPHELGEEDEDPEEEKEEQEDG